MFPETSWYLLVIYDILLVKTFIILTCILQLQERFNHEKMAQKDIF